MAMFCEPTQLILFPECTGGLVVPTTIPTNVQEIERASWSQGIQTLISILIGAALAVSVGELQKTATLDENFIVRLASFVIYCVGFFWFYHKFYIFFYRRASFMSILLPSIVGSSLVATAYTINDSRSFWGWTVALIAGSSYSTAATTFNCWRGKYMVIQGLPMSALKMLSVTMLRSALFLALMGIITSALLWTSTPFNFVNLDLILFVANGFLFGIMSFCNWTYFTKPLEKLVRETGNGDVASAGST
jgi:membrane-associated HD superfamily phosphohydrolase